MIRSGTQIVLKWKDDPSLSDKEIAYEMDRQLAEILSVVKPIANKPYSYDAKMWDDFYNLVSELEALKEAHGKDTAD